MGKGKKGVPATGSGNPAVARRAALLEKLKKKFSKKGSRPGPNPNVYRGSGTAAAKKSRDSQMKKGKKKDGT